MNRMTRTIVNLRAVLEDAGVLIAGRRVEGALDELERVAKNVDEDAEADRTELEVLRRRVEGPLGELEAYVGDILSCIAWDLRAAVDGEPEVGLGLAGIRVEVDQRMSPDAWTVVAQPLEGGRVRTDLYRTQRGSDIYASLKLGAPTPPGPVCGRCSGSGNDPFNLRMACARCGGSGRA